MINYDYELNTEEGRLGGGVNFGDLVNVTFVNNTTGLAQVTYASIQNNNLNQYIVGGMNYLPSGQSATVTLLSRIAVKIDCIEFQTSIDKSSYTPLHISNKYGTNAIQLTYFYKDQTICNINKE